jgi:hypothetical protein
LVYYGFPQEAEKAALEASKNSVPLAKKADSDDVIEMTEDGSFDASSKPASATAASNAQLTSSKADEILPPTESEKAALSDMAAKEEEEDKTPPRTYSSC